MSLTSSQALSMSQQVYTTVSKVEPLAGQRGGHRLVDQREPVAGLSLADPDQAELRHGDKFKIHVTGCLGDLDGPPGEFLGRVQVGHPVGAGHRQPAVQRSGSSGSSSRSARPTQPLAAAKLAKFAL